MRKERDQFTNIAAPKISADTHFEVKDIDIGIEEKEKTDTG